MNYPIARNITGLALLIKASNKFSENETDQSEKYYKEALSIGYSDYYVKKNCQKYCKNIESMLEYFETEKVTL